jgi:predicted Rossmann-fold nucleotide-binding protein
MVVRSADAVVAFPGKYGTLSEMAFALHARKPLVAVNAWRLGDEIHQAETPLEAAELAMKMARGEASEDEKE